MTCIIFDLDGVLVDTAKCHYQAWKRLAAELGFQLDESYLHKLKGISRMASLDSVLAAGGVNGLSQTEKEALAHRKNSFYLEMVGKLDETAILPGIGQLLPRLKTRGCKIGLGSVSKSGGKILNQLGLNQYFDAVVDGNLVTRPKPDSQVFTLAADMMEAPYSDCTVVEDAAAGVQAAKSCGMRCIGIGDSGLLKGTDIILPTTLELLNVL